MNDLSKASLLKILKSKSKNRDLSVSQLVMPLFVVDGESRRVAVASMPGIYKYSVDLLVKEVQELYRLGICMVALFPSLDDRYKDKKATESRNPNGLLQKAVKAIKKSVPSMIVITDVAMDPYSSDGHDGLVIKGEIDNDQTLPILADMAVAQAKAGADVVAPSDMMDARVGFIRKALDKNGFKDVPIISYAAKYASAFYGPFRDALDSTPKAGDKKTYQMDVANIQEAIEEVKADVDEGACVVMVKPALAYLDVIALVAEHVKVPVAAYNVSGEYACVKAGVLENIFDENKKIEEILKSIKRAGADIIFTYFAKQYALNQLKR